MTLTLTILSLSASDTSVGRSCAADLAAILREHHDVEVIDIRSLPPVWVDQRGLDPLPESYASVNRRLRRSHGVILVLPIYCYSASSPAKAMIELFGSALERMPVALVTAAGSVRSHLAAADLMKSLMFEQETFCFPKTVLATADDLIGDRPSTDLARRLSDLAREFTMFATVLDACRTPRTTSQDAAVPPTLYEGEPIICGEVA